MGKVREDATSGEYVDAVRGGANTAELVAPIVGMSIDRARRSLNGLHNLTVLERTGPAHNGTYVVRA